MRVLHYDCFAGISGDMNLGALMDLGADREVLRSQLAALGLPGWSLSFRYDTRGGIRGTRADVACEEEPHAHAHAHRSLADIRTLIMGARLSERVKRDAIAVFQALAEAEGRVHGKPADEVHFHEVGAVDSIVDIVGAAVCLEYLRIDKITASPVELGGGTVRCQHGVLPVPAPATALLAEKFPSKIGGAPHECTTPTGAAILAALGSDFGAPVEGKILASGIGIGQRDCPELPNVLRVMLYETQEPADGTQEQTLCETAANIDDMTGEQLAALAEMLFAAGALDVWQEPIFMKKGRAGCKVCALCAPETLDKVRACFFTHSTSLGVRTAAVSRRALARETFERETPLGKVRFKRAVFGNTEHVKPEADDCLRIARETGLPFDTVARRLIHDIEG